MRVSPQARPGTSSTPLLLFLFIFLILSFGGGESRETSIWFCANRPKSAINCQNRRMHLSTI